MSRKRSHDDVSEDNVFVYYEDTDLLSSIPNDITSLRIDSSVRVIPVSAFQNRRSLVTVEYQEGLQVIGEEAFRACIRLQKIQQFPSTLVAIERSAFEGCSQLESVGRLPLSLKDIAERTFHSCPKLQSIEIPNPGCSLGEWAFTFCLSLTYVRLPEGLKTIPEGLFCGCILLVDVNLPSAIVTVGSHALWKCESLTHLDLSRCGNLTSVGSAAFVWCSELKSVLLPRTGLKRIESRTFDCCTSLTHLWIPPTVERIEYGAFANCTSLLSVEVPETLEHLQFVPFFDTRGGIEILCRCKALVNLHLPPSDTEDAIGDYSVSVQRTLEDTKLFVAADGYEDLVQKLRGRFNSLPLHRACYFQSYHALQDTIDSIRKTTKVDPAACSQLDFAGMNPFHILALSHTPSLDIFKELLAVSSVDILKCRDVFGCTALDYLCKNHSTTAVCATKSLLPSVLEPARVSFLGLDRWRDELQSGLERVQTADSTSLGTEVASVCQNLALYERMEALSLLEMAVWRMKVEEENATSMDTRESCRVNCGSDIVLVNVASLMDTRATP